MSDQVARGIRFSMLFPPGWQEFRPDLESEKALTALATAGAREAGRADVVMAIRQHVHRMFEGLRRRRAVGVHLPVAVPGDLTVPASLTVVPVQVTTGSTLDRAVTGLATGQTPELVEVDGARWYRWIERQNTLEGSDEAGSTTIHYVIPRPDEGEPTAGLHLIFAVTMLAEDRDSEFTRALESLGHGIIGTFAWGERT
ncbi:hypothetical protein [Microbacterium sp. NPDC055357]